MNEDGEMLGFKVTEIIELQDFVVDPDPQTAAARGHKELKAKLNRDELLVDPPEDSVVGTSFEKLAARLRHKLLVVALGQLLCCSDRAARQTGGAERR